MTGSQGRRKRLLALFLCLIVAACDAGVYAPPAADDQTLKVNGGNGGDGGGM